MPVPWKKVKSTRISRLVNDHLNISQKRRDGSSLVVETGFPTSLIDLFIKNRGKLTKPSRRRLQSQPIASPGDVYDPVIEGSPISCPSPPPPPPPSLAGSPPPARSPSPQGHTPVPPPPPPPPSCADEIRAEGSSGGSAVDGVDVDKGGGGEGDGDVNGVLIGVLKVFVVMVLALATKRLTVGITISAVLLLLLEYVGKHCKAAMPAVLIGRRFSRCKKLEEKQEPSTKPVSFPPNATVSRSSILETQPLEDSLSRERTGHQETELVEMAMKREESISDLTECKKKSRKAKIKSKMQKIVPKKFRGTKKEQDLPSPQMVKDEQCEDKSISSSSSSSSVSECCEEEDGKSSIICLDGVTEESETKIEERSCRIEARRYMLLCLIVLAGLIGGRPFALALTLLWFLLLKLGQALPMIMSFNVKSG